MASFLQIRAIHYDFKEHDIFLDIRSPLQLTEGTEQGAAAGNVHVPPRSLERWTVGIRSEGVGHVLHVVLIQKHDGDLLSEWPAE